MDIQKEKDNLYDIFCKDFNNGELLVFDDTCEIDGSDDLSFYFDMVNPSDGTKFRFWVRPEEI